MLTPSLATSVVLFMAPAKTFFRRVAAPPYLCLLQTDLRREEKKKQTQKINALYIVVIYTRVLFACAIKGGRIIPDEAEYFPRRPFFIYLFFWTTFLLFLFFFLLFLAVDNNESLLFGDKTVRQIQI